MVNMNTVHNKPLRLFATFTLILLVSMPILAFNPAAAQETTYLDKSFSWDYDGKHWNWNLSIPAALYDSYKSVPVSTRTRNGPEGYGYLTTTQDSYIGMLAQKLNETTTDLGYNSYDKVSFVLAFVQSLPYTSDNVTQGYNEYPRFPIETLVDGGGDCEDTSILFATITLIMGYGTVYINPTNHYAVGILGDNLKGTYWEYPEDSGQKYYYCETTGDGFRIGQIPDTYNGASAYIYPIEERSQYVPSVMVYAPTTAPTPTKIPLIGSTTPVPTANPEDQDPTTQTPRPLSFNIVEENPLLFIVIILAIAFSFAMVIWSARRPRRSSEPIPDPAPAPPPSVQEVSMQTEVVVGKYCIFCGAQNRDCAVYCERCGKQIA
jgi:hypothetical protein